MTGGAPTIGGLRRLEDQIGGDDRWDVNITGGTIENIAINSYDMPDGGSIQSTDQIPVIRNGTGYIVTNAGGGGGSAVWGDITGTLSNQTDLQAALNAKQATLVSGSNIKTINGNSLLGSGDISISGTGGNALTYSVNQVAHGFSVKDVLYKNGSNYAKAQSNAAATCDVVGIVSAVADANNFTITTSGIITTTGLTVGQYFLSDATAGLLTQTAPTADTSIWKPVGIAISTTQLQVNIQSGIFNGPSDVPMTGDMTKAVYDPAGVNQQLLGVSAAQAITNKTINGANNTITNVSLVTAVTGNLPVTNLNSGTSASSSTFWRGDGTWAAPVTTGDVFGPSSSADNAIARFDTTTGKLIQNSGVIIDDSNNITGVGTLGSGSHIIVSSSSDSLTVGPSGATNPLIKVDCSTASGVSGMQFIQGTSGNDTIVNAISSGSNAGWRWQCKGTSNFSINVGNFILSSGLVARFTAAPTFTSVTPTTRTNAAASTPFFSVTAGTGTTLNTTVESPLARFDLSAIQTHANGTIASQRDMRVIGSTHAFASGTQTITYAAAFSVDGASIAGTSAAITDSSTIHSGGVNVGSGVTNSWGLNIKANTGATNNYIARFEGSAGEVLRLRTDGQIALLATNTPSGTTGAQTINKPSGTVNFAAAATSLVVTNSLCTTSSIIIATVGSNDATMKSVAAVAGNGSFTLYANAAATAETIVNFIVIN